MEFISLLFLAALVGLLVGITGIGGILLIPGIAMLGGLPTHEAMATALFSFILVGISGTISFQRNGGIDWSMALPLSLGGGIFSALGAWANIYVSAPPLNCILGLVILFAGCNALRPRTALGKPWAPTSPHRTKLLFGIGACTGFVAGLTGVGGPVLSIPFMIILGFQPIVGIVCAMPYQIATALTGSLSNYLHGTINFAVGLPVSVAEVTGILVGTSLARRTSAKILRLAIGIICLVVGAFVLVKALAQYF
ncbi:MAG: sulfite exporter TauE/SafE family protein [Desulfovibrionaceae bacterium]